MRPAYFGIVTSAFNGEQSPHASHRPPIPRAAPFGKLGRRPVRTLHAFVGRNRTRYGVAKCAFVPQVSTLIENARMTAAATLTPGRVPSANFSDTSAVAEALTSQSPLIRCQLKPAARFSGNDVRHAALLLRDFLAPRRKSRVFGLGRFFTDAENPGKILVALNERGLSTDWFLTGKEEMILTSQPARTANLMRTRRRPGGRRQCQRIP
jgi:hypothetical protein